MLSQVPSTVFLKYQEHWSKKLNIKVHFVKQSSLYNLMINSFFYWSNWTLSIVLKWQIVSLFSLLSDHLEHKSKSSREYLLYPQEQKMIGHCISSLSEIPSRVRAWPNKDYYPQPPGTVLFITHQMAKLLNRCKIEPQIWFLQKGPFGCSARGKTMFLVKAGHYRAAQEQLDIASPGSDVSSKLHFSASAISQPQL